MVANIGLVDRFIRLVLFVLIMLSHTNKVFSSSVDDILLIGACFLIITVIIGICPFYSLLGINTNQAEKAH